MTLLSISGSFSIYREEIFFPTFDKKYPIDTIKNAVSENNTIIIQFKDNQSCIIPIELSNVENTSDVAAIMAHVISCLSRYVEANSPEAKEKKKSPRKNRL